MAIRVATITWEVELSTTAPLILHSQLLLHVRIWDLCWMVGISSILRWGLWNEALVTIRSHLVGLLLGHHAC